MKNSGVFRLGVYRKCIERLRLLNQAGKLDLDRIRNPNLIKFRCYHLLSDDTWWTMDRIPEPSETEIRIASVVFAEEVSNNHLDPSQTVDEVVGSKGVGESERTGTVMRGLNESYASLKASEVKTAFRYVKPDL